MSQVTYQTKCPESIIEFCDLMGVLFGKVERDLYKALFRGEKLNDLKRNYQKIYGINARQFNSVHTSIKGKIGSRQECYQNQIDNLSDQIQGLSKSIDKKKKQLKKTAPNCGNGKSKSTSSQLKREIHYKQRRLENFKGKLASLKKNKPSLIFGSKKLWKAQFNLEANGYSSHEEWLKDWRDARNSQFMLVGSKDETQGNVNCQLTSDGTIKINVPPGLIPKFGKYIKADDIKFAYGQGDIDYALSKGKALTFRFVRKNGIWYIFCTVDRAEIPYQCKYSNGMLGIDLNPGVIGWAYCDSRGNLKAKGQINLNITDRTSNQIEATLGDACKQLVAISSSFNCPITIESLNFSRKKARMREQGVKYSRMLSNFAYKKFAEILASRCERFGIELITVNPAYSSLIGLVKFMGLYGLSSDTAAALVLARRALRKSERIPAKIALCLQVDRHKHSWSLWNALGKKLKGIRRHAYYQFRDSNRIVEVIRLRELELSKNSNRRGRKPQGTSTRGMRSPRSNRK